MTDRTPDELIAIAKALKIRNAQNKRRIQAHRTQIAISKANREGIAHKGQFLSQYKYG